MPDSKTNSKDLGQLFNLKSSFPAKADKKAFFEAARDNRRKVLGRILDKWPDAAAKWRDSSGDAVIAASGGALKLKTLQYLVSRGANIDDCGKAGNLTRSALQAAVFSGRAEEVEKLLRAGAAADSLNQYGKTPLLYAVEGGRRSCIDLLVLAGADPYRKDKFGTAPFDKARSEEMRDIMRATRKRRADFLAAAPEAAPPAAAVFSATAASVAATKASPATQSWLRRSMKNLFSKKPCEVKKPSGFNL